MALGSWETSCESRRSRSADPGKSRRKVRPSVRVRVSGMGLVLVGSFLAFWVEALAASAGGPVVRVAHEEAAPRDAFRVVHARAIEVFLAVAVDEGLECVGLDDRVVLVYLPVVIEALSGAEAAAACLVDVAPPVVRLGHFELDFSISALSGPVARPLDEKFPYAGPAPIRCHPDVVNKALRLGCHETALAEDQIPEELVVRGLGDAALCSVSRHIRLHFFPEMGFPLP